MNVGHASVGDHFIENAMQGHITINPGVYKNVKSKNVAQNFFQNQILSSESIINYQKAR